MKGTHANDVADRLQAFGCYRIRFVVFIGAALMAMAIAGGECFAGEPAASPQADAGALILDGADGRNDSFLRTADARGAVAARGHAFPFNSLPPRAAAIGGAEQLANGWLTSRPRDPYNDVINVNLPANDFADTGPGTVKFSVAGLDVDSQRSVAGGRMQVIGSSDERGVLLVESRLFWLYEYLQTTAGASSFFAPGDKAIFAVQGLSYGYNWAMIGSGVRYELLDGWSAYAGYDAQVNSQQLFHIGSGGLRYAW